MGPTPPSPAKQTGVRPWRSDPAAATHALTTPVGAAERERFRGVRFGRYDLLYRLGEGAMAAVFAAYDPALDREVALKFIRSAGPGDSEGRARVQREAQALARVSHPNVVQIFEVGREGDQIYVAMEMVHGLTLEEWQRARPRTLPEVLAMYVQAGRGLVAAHAVGIIHRDFKPANVLVGDDGRARIADFGLARVLASPEPQTGARPPSPARPVSMTETGMVVGTPAYMSPEQHHGAHADERSDQFSFCAALYEAVHGVRPFAGETVEAIAAEIDAGRLAPPPQPDHPSPALHAALLRGMSLRPEDRWPSLTALLDHLARLDPARDDHAARRHRRAFTLGFAAVLLALTAAVGIEQRLTPAALTPLHILAISLILLASVGVGAWAVRRSLLRHAFHRAMIAAVAHFATVSVVVFGLGAVADAPVPLLVMSTLAGAGLVAGVLATFVLRALWPLVLTWLGAALVAAAAPDHAVLAGAVAVAAFTLLLARAWARAARTV